MNHQVLLADDSITIQKVIKITLANQPYDITECSSEDELFQKLPKVQPKIVFLDFNLSEKYTGYDLCSKIHELVPTAKILLLLGTFDTVDDAAMEKCGASDKIVKPFDSNKFIAICRQMIETFDEEEIPYPTTKKDHPSPSLLQAEPEDQWEMSHSTDPLIQIEDEPAFEVEVTHPNALAKEITDWGMSVPGVIGQENTKSTIELPPVISSQKTAAPVKTEVPVAKDKVASPFDQKFPDNTDLDYPTLESFNEEKPVTEKPAARKPQLVPLESLRDEPIGLELEGNYVEDKTDINSLEAQIHDEVADDLWHADEFEDLKEKVSSRIEEMKSGFQPSRNDFDDSLFKSLDDADSITWNDTGSDIFAKPSMGEATNPGIQISNSEDVIAKLRPEMEDLVKKYVKEYLDEMFRKNVEKVSWEVIPDLAENLIRQELGKIADKIISQTK